ncbi:MAG: hypothetical protein EA398_05710 [Deltaproteobacteria bacterium]|nr:MAG: hypothetical protein EA398_05710 [Deltaproteobacteria bacterium]
MIHRTVPFAIGTLLMALGSMACLDTDFEQAWELRKLRILAVVATPPEVGPGEELRLEALSWAPEDAPVSHHWEFCLVTGAPADGYPCEALPGVPDLDGLDPRTGDLVTLLNPLDEAMTDTLCEALAGFTGEPCVLGVPIMVRLSARSGEEERVSVRQVLLLTAAASARPDRNLPPEVPALTWDGLPLGPEDPTPVPTPAEGEDVRLQIAVPGTSAQSFEDPRTGEERVETLTASWFTTAGELEFRRTFFGPRAPMAELQRNRLSPTTARPLEPGSTLDLVVVLRDNRGGVASIQRRVLLEHR